ncbi:MAG: hypothetical protein H6825_12115 [Planctomycetes bacterium]|nr:hypothetical protein [Planctomycetota bacterium]
MANDADERHLEWIRGTVIDSTKRTEMHVWSEGGGGTVGPTGGSVSPPQIYSQNTTIQEIWLSVEVTGDEKALSYRGVDIPLRKGNRVSIGMLANGESVVLVNHATKEMHFLANPGWVAMLVGDLPAASVALKAFRADLTGCLWTTIVFVGSLYGARRLLELSGETAFWRSALVAAVAGLAWAMLSAHAVAHRRKLVAQADMECRRWVRQLVDVELGR